jgi:dienelactone hydrolase
MPRRLSGEAADLRSRLHGYGGGTYAAAALPEGGVMVVWRDDRDGGLWRLDLPPAERPPAERNPAEPPLTPLPLPEARRLCEPDPGSNLADGLIDLRRGLWIGIREAGEHDDLVAVPLAGGPVRSLRALADFGGYPVLSPQGSHLAWVEWQRPAMPWQESQLWLGALTAAGELAGCQVVAGEPHTSVFQPLWLPQPGRAADLVVSCDRSGWWNLERLEGAEALPLPPPSVASPSSPSPETQAAEPLPWQPLLPLQAEFGMPQWVAGMATTAWDGEALVAAACLEGRWQLGRLPLPATTPRWTPYPLPFDDLAGVSAADGQVVAIAAGPTLPAGLLELASGSGAWRHHPSSRCPLAPETISRPEPLWFAGHGGARTHAWYYPPAGGGHPGAPLLVKGHSGPTAMARTGVSLAIQFWTRRGWGVVDVNYGGSTGFGRAYRERLDGQWGVADVADCAAAAEALVAAGLADRQRIAIEGGSAAGFTVLAALCFTKVFRAGACRYAVADLEGMARHSHRFEERYLDSLLGPWPQAAELYRQRSPLRHAERITAPVIFFQGLDDTVVPPEQTERMVVALQQRAVPVEVHLFPGEGHGFRDSAVQTRVLEATEAFFRRHFQLA